MKKCRFCDTKFNDDCIVCTGCGASDFIRICPSCGHEIEIGLYCSVCGTPVNDKATQHRQADSSARPVTNYVKPEIISPDVSDKSRLVALLLCYFLGIFGAHNFYAGKTKMGLLYLFTVGLFGIGWFVDLIMIAVGNFKDAQNRFVKTWMN